jgi:hypothetical protein
LRGAQMYIQKTGISPEEHSRRTGKFAWFIIILIVMNLTTFLPGRLLIFRGFADEAVKPLAAVPDTLSHNSLILVSTRYWKFGYPRNPPDIRSENGPFFVRDPGTGNTGKLATCFPGYEIYRLMLNRKTSTWQLENIHIDRSKTDEKN